MKQKEKTDQADIKSLSDRELLNLIYEDIKDGHKKAGLYTQVGIYAGILFSILSFGFLEIMPSLLEQLMNFLIKSNIV